MDEYNKEDFDTIVEENRRIFEKDLERIYNIVNLAYDYIEEDDIIGFIGHMMEYQEAHTTALLIDLWSAYRSRSVRNQLSFLDP